MFLIKNEYKAKHKYLNYYSIIEINKTHKNCKLYELTLKIYFYSF